ncbi:MAG: LptF/LptG family permease, partial [Paracoccaceae bacterium]
MCWIRVFILFYLFSLMIEMANQLRWHADLTDFKTVFFLAVLNSTEVVYTIMPLIMIFASIWLFLALARSSELVVARASGRSGLTFLLGPIGVSVLLSGLILVFLNPIVAYSTARYLTLSQEIKNEGRSVFSIGTEGLWLRQGDTDGYTVVRASGANGAGSVFYDV